MAVLDSHSFSPNGRFSSFNWRFSAGNRIARLLGDVNWHVAFVRAAGASRCHVHQTRTHRATGSGIKRRQQVTSLIVSTRDRPFAVWLFVVAPVRRNNFVAPRRVTWKKRPSRIFRLWPDPSFIMPVEFSNVVVSNIGCGGSVRRYVLCPKNLNRKCVRLHSSGPGPQTPARTWRPVIKIARAPPRCIGVLFSPSRKYNRATEVTRPYRQLKIPQLLSRPDCVVYWPINILLRFLLASGWYAYSELKIFIVATKQWILNFLSIWKMMLKELIKT